LRLSSQYAVAAVNLADLYRQLGKDGEGENVLRASIANSPRAAALRHAFGLTLTRLKRPDEARAEFQKATELEPESPQYVYVYAVSLYSGGRTEEAMTVLKKAVTRHPNDRSILSALIALSRTNGDADAALTYAQRLAVITPDDTNLTKLIDDLRQATKPSAR